MDVQQLIAWILVAVAAVYLVRLGISSWKAMWSARGGACSTCLIAQIAAHRHTLQDGAPGAVIPLSAVDPSPSKRDE